MLRQRRGISWVIPSTNARSELDRHTSNSVVEIRTHKATPQTDRTCPHHTSMARQMSQTHRLAHSYTSLAKVFIPQTNTPFFLTQMCHVPIYTAKIYMLNMYNTNISPCTTRVQPPTMQDANIYDEAKQTLHSSLQHISNNKMRTQQQKATTHHGKSQPKTHQQTRQTKVRSSTFRKLHQSSQQSICSQHSTQTLDPKANKRAAQSRTTPTIKETLNIEGKKSTHVRSILTPAAVTTPANNSETATQEQTKSDVTPTCINPAPTRDNTNQTPNKSDSGPCSLTTSQQSSKVGKQLTYGDVGLPKTSNTHPAAPNQGNTGHTTSKVNNASPAPTNNTDSTPETNHHESANLTTTNNSNNPCSPIKGKHRQHASKVRKQLTCIDAGLPKTNSTNLAAPNHSHAGRTTSKASHASTTNNDPTPKTHHPAPAILTATNLAATTWIAETTLRRQTGPHH